MKKGKATYLIRLDYKIIEGSSAFQLIFISWYNVVFSSGGIIQKALTDGFRQVLPEHFWLCGFMGVGLYQLWVICSENFIGRAVSVFCATTLFLWGGLNILIYSHYWHISFIIWWIFAGANLYILTRILQVIGSVYEPLRTD